MFREKLVDRSRPISAAEMKAIDRNCEAFGVPTLLLMENAGRAVADAVTEALGGNVVGKRIAVFTGAGGKAGDGLAASRHLAARGAIVDIYMLTPPDHLGNEAAKTMYRAVEFSDLSISIRIVKDDTDLPRELSSYDAVIDALLGIGVRGRVRYLYRKAIELINSFQGPRISIDIPSGIDPDTGEVLGIAVKATVTVTLHRPKKGLENAREYIGKLIVADIGIPIEAELYVGPGDVELLYRRRPMKCHKGWAGRVVVIGGSETYTGAPTLAALAALRAGADLAIVVAPRRAADIAAATSPNLITVPLPGSRLGLDHTPKILELLDRATCVVIGPGLGLDEETQLAIKTILEEIDRRGLPTVIDADALKAIARWRAVPRKAVLTPHTGEFSKLFGVELPEDLDRRIETVARCAKEIGAVILLKSWIDIVSDGDRVKLNKTHVPAMAVGGTGDVLSGIVAALISRGIPLFEAAYLGAFINGLAGCIAYAELGDHILATDIIDRIPIAIEKSFEMYVKYGQYRRIR